MRILWDEFFRVLARLALVRVVTLDHRPLVARPQQRWTVFNPDRIRLPENRVGQVWLPARGGTAGLDGMGVGRWFRTCERGFPTRAVKTSRSLMSAPVCAARVTEVISSDQVWAFAHAACLERLS
jgi:hypothetical protein